MKGPTRLGRFLVAFRRRIADVLELRDVVFFGGLAIAGAGGAMLSVPWTLIAIGALLAILGKFGR